MNDPRDDHAMGLALDQARNAWLVGEVPVGAVILRQGQVIATGYNRPITTNDPTAHAEIEAIRAACRDLATLDLTGSILYTNVEPCWMCAYAIRQTRISTVIFGTSNTEVGSVHSSVAVLIDARVAMPVPHVEAGLLRDECDQLVAAYRNQ